MDSYYSTNRYSMPVTRSRNGLYEPALDGTNTTRFLFGDDDEHAMSQGSAIDDGFPTLVRQNDQIVSAYSSYCHLIVNCLGRGTHCSAPRRWVLTVAGNWKTWPDDWQCRVFTGFPFSPSAMHTFLSSFCILHLHPCTKCFQLVKSCCLRDAVENSVWIALHAC